MTPKEQLLHDFHLQALEKSENAKKMGELTVVGLGHINQLMLDAYYKGLVAMAYYAEHPPKCMFEQSEGKEKCNCGLDQLFKNIK